VFEFLPKNHSVVRMDPLSPCIPFDLAGHPANELWWSGFYTVESAENVSPAIRPKSLSRASTTADSHRQPGTYTRVVENTDPMWFYCSAPESCIKYSMVGAINAKNHPPTSPPSRRPPRPRTSC
jgi:hypothetical protein